MASHSTEGQTRLIDAVAGSSQVAIAALVGATQQHVSAWMKGRSPAPKWRHAMRRHLGIPEEAWLSEAERRVAFGPIPESVAAVSAARNR